MASEHSDSQETNSTSLMEDSPNTLSFENINYTVREGFFRRGRKTILNGVSGSFNSGELSVIMGQSGAGKSTLMDILAGYTKPTSGSICVNGRVRDEKKFRRRSCYILQDDKVQDMLTTEESLHIAADLKLGNHISKEMKRDRVNETIKSLGLSKSRNTKAGNLSGGEKKRLAIGLELFSEPTVMFLDEPTSGLDSSISKQIVYLLHLLARQGRTVVVTMHQPSAILLRMVDRMYAMVAGRCSYVGSETQLLPYLEEVKLMCPPYHNPVDFLIEICQDNVDVLMKASENGKSTRWFTNISHEADSNLINTINLSTCEDICLTSLPTPKENQTSKILLALKSTYSTSYWKQFTTLTRRAILTQWRNPSFTIMTVFIHCAMALFIGILFYNIGGDAKHVRDSYNFLYFSLMFLMFTAFSSVSINFPEQISVIRREHFNRWYTAGAYYLSTIISTLPTQTVCTLTYALIAYFMTGQPLEFQRIASFCFILLLVSFVSICKGMFTGSLFNVKSGTILGPFFLMPFIVFSGFFLRYCDAPVYSHWLFEVSFLKHGLVGLVLSIFGMDRPNLACAQLYCHYAYPNKFLQDNGIVGEKFSVLISALFGIGSIACILAFIVLKIRLKHKW